MSRLEDDDIVSTATLRRFELEAFQEGGNGLYCGFILRTNGELLVHHPSSWMTIPEQTMWAADTLKRLNRELHHDGAWVVVFTDPAPDGKGDIVVSQGSGHREYARYALMWMDEDGDIQFTVEWVRGESELLDWVDVLLQGVVPIMQKAEAAWQIWHTHMREVIDPAEGQTFKRAKGERPTSARH